MNWKYVKALKSENAIEEFESTIKFEFPESFKEIVTNYNGGRPEKDIYDTDKTKERTIKSLLSFNKEDKENIWKMVEWDSNGLCKQYITFAIDHFGNLICFSVKDKTIVFIDMETLTTEIIAPDFSAFIGKLYTVD